ncbi:MAG: gliding motility-associated C-terminal domain-containing protein [Ginsengibacter sp.]
MRRPYITSIVLCLLLMVISGHTVTAQLCQGSLGDPVVNITFGAGSGVASPLPGTLTNYGFVPYSCPADGFYSIGNSSPNCFNDTWHTVPEDHTPNDVNGYMMIVNASFNPGDFYVQPVDGLCDNTTYEFAAWILNILKISACGSAGIRPNVTFRIETTSGTVLQSYTTGDIPMSAQPTWQQYGLFFTTPVNVNSVVIRMTNNAPGGCGNDLVLDDITFRPCGPLVNVAIANSSNSVIVCEGDKPTFDFSSTVVPTLSNTSYQWQVSTDMGVTWSDIAGATSASYKRLPVNGLGMYKYRVAVAQGNYVLIPSCSRVLSEPLTVNQVALPVAGAANNGPVCEGSTLVLNSNSASSYTWTGPANYSSNQSSPAIGKVSLNYNGKFYVKIVSAEGCTNTDSTVVSIIPGPLVDAGSDANICEGATTQLAGSTTAATYIWQPAQSLSDNSILNPVASPTSTTQYVLSVDNGTCQKSDSVLVSVNKKPIANAGPDKVLIQGDATLLGATSNVSGVSILWKPNLNIATATDLTPLVNPPVSTTYTLTLSSNYGCGTSQDSVFVKVFSKLFIPNAFSPNGDGINDTWRIEPLEAYPMAVLKIFNRYGQMIFTNNGLPKQWDGKYKGTLQPVGVYAYTINLRNGSPIIKGVVNLLL